MNLRPGSFASIVCFAFALALLRLPEGHAGKLDTQDWPGWNAVSGPFFPGASWQRYATPEEAGWSSAGLARARETSERAGSAAVMVIYNGAILDQWGRVERRYMCHSVRKSLLSGLYGIAVAKGEIDIQASIASLEIDDDPGLTPTEKTAKVSDLLKSRSGVYLPAAYETRSAKEERPARGSHEPGTHWYYNNWDFNVLSTIYNRQTGGDLFEAFQTQIAQPLQMEDFALRHTYYHLEPENSRHPAYPFRMSARDLARFGLLFLTEGMWRDTQIISSDWVRESTKAYSTRPDGGYGYMWWTLSGSLAELGTYAAFGYGGHAIYVVPGARLVLVHRADTYKQERVDYRLIRRILREVLEAREGPPRAQPALETLPASPPSEGEADLTEDQLARLTGAFRHERFTATVRVVEDRLEVHSPRQGRFALIARTPLEFVIEDAELPLAFKLDGGDRAKEMWIWFDPDEPYKMPRAR